MYLSIQRVVKCANVIKNCFTKIHSQLQTRGQSKHKQDQTAVWGFLSHTWAEAMD